MNLADLRREYARAALDERTVDPDPVRQFLTWLEEAARAELPEPNAMTLATADAHGVPSARIVLLKGADVDGLVFYCDRRSLKGRDLARNPAAALLFWWSELERQVRITGNVTLASDLESDAYFKSRPEGSRISAWASHQSEAVPDRAALEAHWEEAARHFADGNIPRPAWWGGFRVKPLEFEFWQGRPNRLHDRVRYQIDAGHRWIITRLSP